MSTPLHPKDYAAGLWQIAHELRSLQPLKRLFPSKTTAIAARMKFYSFKKALFNSVESNDYQHLRTFELRLEPCADGTCYLRFDNKDDVFDQMCGTAAIGDALDKATGVIPQSLIDAQAETNAARQLLHSDDPVPSETESKEALAHFEQVLSKHGFTK